MNPFTHGWMRAVAGRTPTRGWRRPFVVAFGMMCSALPGGPASGQSMVQLDPDGAPNDRVVFIATRVTDEVDDYVNQCDPRVARVPLLSAGTIDPDDDLIPNWDLIKTELDNECTPSYNGVICLDWERDFFDALKSGPSHPNFYLARSKGIALANFIRTHRPNAKVGYYAFPPAKWNVEQSHLQPLIDAVDVFFPAGAIGNSDNYPQKLVRFHKNVKFALEISEGRPVVPFHCPRMTHQGNKLLDMDHFESHMGKSFDVEVEGRRAAGIVIWDQTIRMYYQNELQYIDSQHIPDGMDLMDYATQLQRSYICRARNAVIPDTACSELMPGEQQNGMISGSDGPSLPDQQDGESGWTGEVAGVQQRRHIIHLDEPETEESPSGAIFGVATKEALADGVPKGTNLPPLNPYVAGWPFTNLLWVSSPWTVLDAQGDEVAADKFAFGYPLPKNNQTSQTVIGEDLKSILPPGKWLALFEGQGTVDVAGDATTIRKMQGRVLFRVTPTEQGAIIKLTSVPTNDPLRNLRVMPVSAIHTADAPTLHASLTGPLKESKPTVLRFASWQMIDGSPLVEWADRTTVGNVSQMSDRGAAIELMIQVCNEVNADPWFCMPHLASDEFVQEFAALVAASLDPGRRVFVEYSNDVMDPSRPQFEDVAELGGADELGATPLVAAASHHARRSGEVFDMWREAFAGQHDRVVCVLSVPGDSPSAAGLVLGYDSAVSAADAIAVSGGYGGYAMAHDLAAMSSGLSVDSVVDMLTQQQLEDMPSFTTVASMARGTGKPMLVSMSGAGLLVHAAQFDPELIELLHKVESDPRTNALSEAENALWHEQGAVLILSDDRTGGAP